MGLALEPKETPLTSRLHAGNVPATPAFCRKELRENIEPAYGVWLGITNLIDDILPDDDDEFVNPSQNLIRLMSLRDTLHRATYRMVPNPDYSEESCRQWKEDHPVNPIVWGQKYWGEGEISDEMRESLRVEYNKQALEQERKMLSGGFGNDESV